MNDVVTVLGCVRVGRVRDLPAAEMSIMSFCEDHELDLREIVHDHNSDRRMLFGGRPGLRKLAAEGVQGLVVPHMIHVSPHPGIGLRTIDACKELGLDIYAVLPKVQWVLCRELELRDRAEAVAPIVHDLSNRVEMLMDQGVQIWKPLKSSNSHHIGNDMGLDSLAPPFRANL